MKLSIPAVFLLAAASPAWGATYEVELVVTASAPAETLFGLDEEIVYQRIFIDAAAGKSDVTVTTSHPNFTCEIRDEAVFAVFRADSANWPTSLPTSVDCTYGGDTMRIYPVADTDFTSNVEVRSFTASAGITLKRKNEQHGSVMYGMPLPYYAYYVYGMHDASYNGGTWAGVRCGVLDTSYGAVMKIEVKQSAVNHPTGGYCTVDSTTGLTHDVPLKLVAP